MEKDTNINKVDHIEVSAGGTVIVSNAKCPISEEEANKEGIIVHTPKGNVPCCVYYADRKDIMCPYFNYLVSNKTGNTYNCFFNE